MDDEITSLRAIVQELRKANHNLKLSLDDALKSIDKLQAAVIVLRKIKK